MGTRAVRAARCSPSFLLLVGALAGPPRRQAWWVFLRLRGEELATAFARAGLQLAFMASEAAQMAHAIGLSLVRMLVTQRRLLEWETAATTAARVSRRGPRGFARAMVSSPV